MEFRYEDCHKAYFKTLTISFFDNFNETKRIIIYLAFRFNK